MLAAFKSEISDEVKSTIKQVESKLGASVTKLVGKLEDANSKRFAAVDASVMALQDRMS